MSDQTESFKIEGWDQIIQWFGNDLPDFHDAEILSLTLSRNGESILRVYPYCPSKPTTVEFYLEDITDLELSDFSGQNVISSLTLERVSDQTNEPVTRIRLGPCYGLSGWIDARRVRVELRQHGSSETITSP